MRAYKIEVADDGEVLATRYAGTQADARAVRDRLVEELGVKKKAVTTEEVEIPVDKAGLLEFVNTLAEASDLEPDPEDA